MRSVFHTAICTLLGLILASCGASSVFNDTIDAPQTYANAYERNTPPWMQGFPPSADKTLRFSDRGFFTESKLKWTVCNFSELMPTTGVTRGNAHTDVLPTATDPHMVIVRFASNPQASNANMDAITLPAFQVAGKSLFNKSKD